MPWITVTDEDVLPKVSKERIQIAAVKGRDDLSDTVQEITETFRAAIAARGFELGADGTIPSGLAHHVQAMALWHFLTQGVPANDKVQTDARKQADDEARKVIDAIYAGQVAIEAVNASAIGRAGCWNSENKLVMRAHPVPPPATQFQTSATRRYANPNAPADS